MNIKIKTLIIIVINLPLIVFSQTKTINMEEAVNLTKQNYPAIKAAQLNVEKYDKLKSSAFDFGTTSVVTGKENIKDNKAEAIVNFGITQSDIDLLGIVAKRKYQQSQTAVAQAEYQLTENNIELFVRNAFNNLLHKKALLAVYQQIDTIYANFVKSAELRYKTQETSKLALLTAKAKYNELKLQVKQLEGEKKSAKANLNQYLCLNEDFTVEETPFITDFSNKSIDNNSDLALMKAQIMQAERNWKRQRSTLLPKFSASYTNKKVADVSGFHSYEFGISVPLFSGSFSQNKATKVQWQIQQEHLKTNHLNLQSEYLQKKILVENLNERIKYYQEHLIPLSNEQISASKLAYNLGEINYLEFTQAVENSLKTKIDYINANAEYRKAVAEILRILN